VEEVTVVDTMITDTGEGTMIMVEGITSITTNY
jgi:hypothetical protein